MAVGLERTRKEEERDSAARIDGQLLEAGGTRREGEASSHNLSWSYHLDDQELHSYQSALSFDLI